MNNLFLHLSNLLFPRLTLLLVVVTLDLVKVVVLALMSPLLSLGQKVQGKRLGQAHQLDQSKKLKNKDQDHKKSQSQNQNKKLLAGYTTGVGAGYTAYDAGGSGNGLCLATSVTPCLRLVLQVVWQVVQQVVQQWFKQ